MMNKVRKAIAFDQYQRTLSNHFAKPQQSVKDPLIDPIPPKQPFQGLKAIPLGLCAALFYGGVMQVLAGYLEYRDGNNFAALTFCSCGRFWLTFASLSVSAFDFLEGYFDTNVLDHALGVYFLAWTIFTTLVFFSYLRSNLVTVAIFFFLVICLTLLTASKFLDGHRNLQRASGAFGILTAAIAWHSAFAHLLNKGDWFFHLPLFEIPKRKIQPYNATKQAA